MQDRSWPGRLYRPEILAYICRLVNGKKFLEPLNSKYWGWNISLGSAFIWKQYTYSYSYYSYRSLKHYYDTRVRRGPWGRQRMVPNLSGAAWKGARHTINRCFSSSKCLPLITPCNIPVKPGLVSPCPESKRKSLESRKSPNSVTLDRISVWGLLWLGSRHSCWILALMLCPHLYRQFGEKKRKPTGPTFLAEHFSWALPREEVVVPHTQYDPLSLRGELVPAAAKDNKVNQ